MSKSESSIGQEELAVLQYVQDNFPITVREVSDHFSEFGKARTTILTVMERLRSKKFLVRDKVAGSYRYSPRLSQSEVLNSVVGDFVRSMLGGSLSPFVAYMSESKDVSDEELKELRKLVRDLEKNRRENQQ